MNCSMYKSDKEIIVSLPFVVIINIEVQQSITYAWVDNRGTVTRLYILNQEFIPHSIFCLKKLETLSIISSNFSIPADIGQLNSTLSRLTIIDLKEPQKILPIELFMLKNLIRLNLINCGIEILPDAIGNLIRLEELNLTNNSIEILPDSIGNLSALQVLDLKGNNLIGSPPHSIKNLTRLYKLDISSNPSINSIDSLDGSNSLTVLKVSYCGLTSLPRLPYLSYLDASGNKITSLFGFKNSSMLCLPFYRESSITLSANSLRDMCSSLISLDLSKNQLTTLPEEIYNCSNLRALDLSDNKLTTLSEDIYHFQYLQKINLKNNAFSAQECEWIKGGFRRTTSYSRWNARITEVEI